MSDVRPDQYRILREADLRDYLAGCPAVAARLGGAPAAWSISEIGDGNLNLVFLVKDEAGRGVVLKQALPYVRMSGGSWSMTPERERHEVESLTAHRALVPDLVVEVLHHDEKLNWTMIHAGLAPIWTLRQAQRAAQEVERELSSPRHPRLLRNLFGNRPAVWSSRLQGMDRHRATINTLTRMRYCDVNGRIDFDANGVPGTQKPGLYPWFEVPGMRRRDTRIVCGHWSALDRFAGFGVHAIDTGCVWGGKLTALRLDAEELQYITVDAEPHRVRPPGGGD